nr:hypothetical protein [Xanthomonadales bacterium]
MAETKSRFWPLAQGSGTAVRTAGVLAAGAAALWVGWRHILTSLFAVLSLAVLLFLLYFLRDPERRTPLGPGLFVAPADGRVVALEETHEPVFLRGRVTRISIFMSLADVHVNRAPMAGQVAFATHRAGGFLPAYHRNAPDHNESHFLGLEDGETRIAVKQVAGAFARRIECWVSPGQRLARGQRFG